MLITLAAALVALACVVASGRRLVWATAPIGLDPRVLVDALGRDQALMTDGALRRELASDARFSWEREMLAAFEEPDGPARDALVNEQLFDFEARTDRWARVPRVCASIGTTIGLLFGSLALLQGFDAQGADDAGRTMREVIVSALGAVSLGVAATTFCVAVHVRAARAARERRAAVDALVERLRSVSDRGRRTA